MRITKTDMRRARGTSGQQIVVADSEGYTFVTVGDDGGIARLDFNDADGRCWQLHLTPDECRLLKTQVRDADRREARKPLPPADPYAACMETPHDQAAT